MNGSRKAEWVKRSGFTRPTLIISVVYVGFMSVYSKEEKIEDSLESNPKVDKDRQEIKSVS